MPGASSSIHTSGQLPANLAIISPEPESAVSPQPQLQKIAQLISLVKSCSDQLQSHSSAGSSPASTNIGSPSLLAPLLSVQQQSDWARLTADWQPDVVALVEAHPGLAEASPPLSESLFLALQNCAARANTLYAAGCGGTGLSNLRVLIASTPLKQLNPIDSQVWSSVFSSVPTSVMPLEKQQALFKAITDWQPGRSDNINSLDTLYRTLDDLTKTMKTLRFPSREMAAVELLQASLQDLKRTVRGEYFLKIMADEYQEVENGHALSLNLRIGIAGKLNLSQLALDLGMGLQAAKNDRGQHELNTELALGGKLKINVAKQGQGLLARALNPLRTLLDHLHLGWLQVRKEVFDTPEDLIRYRLGLASTLAIVAETLDGGSPLASSISLGRKIRHAAGVASVKQQAEQLRAQLPFLNQYLHTSASQQLRPDQQIGLEPLPLLQAPLKIQINSLNLADMDQASSTGQSGVRRGRIKTTQYRPLAEAWAQNHTEMMSRIQREGWSLQISSLKRELRGLELDHWIDDLSRRAEKLRQLPPEQAGPADLLRELGQLNLATGLKASATPNPNWLNDAERRQAFSSVASKQPAAAEPMQSPAVNRVQAKTPAEGLRAINQMASDAILSLEAVLHSYIALYQGATVDNPFADAGTRGFRPEHVVTQTVLGGEDGSPITQAAPGLPSTAAALENPDDQPGKFSNYLSRKGKQAQAQQVLKRLEQDWKVNGPVQFFHSAMALLVNLEGLYRTSRPLTQPAQPFDSVLEQIRQLITSGGPASFTDKIRREIARVPYTLAGKTYRKHDTLQVVMQPKKSGQKLLTVQGAITYSRQSNAQQDGEFLDVLLDAAAWSRLDDHTSNLDALQTAIVQWLGQQKQPVGVERLLPASCQLQQLGKSIHPQQVHMRLGLENGQYKLMYVRLQNIESASNQHLFNRNGKAELNTDLSIERRTPIEENLGTSSLSLYLQGIFDAGQKPEWEQHWKKWQTKGLEALLRNVAAGNVEDCIPAEPPAAEDEASWSELEQRINTGKQQFTAAAIRWSSAQGPERAQYYQDAGDALFRLFDSQSEQKHLMQQGLFRPE